MKSIIFTFSLLFAYIFTLNANVIVSTDPVNPNEWKEGNYYFLKNGDNYISLDNVKTDSVIVKQFAQNPTKAVIDYALWEITSEANAGGRLYQFKNKKTQAILSFEASDGASLNLAPGIDKWTFESGVIKALYDNAQKTMILTIDNNNLKLSGTGTAFAVHAPDTKFPLMATDLGAGFKVFQLDFDKTYQGNIFHDKNILARDIEDGFVMLQEQGDETFEDGKAKYFGIDTAVVTITNATDVFGAQFSQDSTRTQTHPNAEWQKFKFTVDLKNDSLNIYLAAAPAVNDPGKPSVNEVKMVYVGVGSNNVLTVSHYNTDGTPKQGVIPTVKVKKGEPGNIATGSGVYFLKSASKGETAGKYITAYNNNQIVTINNTPNIYQPAGQWYIKEENGMYRIVDRNTNSTMLSLGEIYPVQGMANTYTFGSNTDSVTVEYQKDVALTNLFLGSRQFTKEEIANNGYVLNLVSSTGVNNLFVITSDTLLQGKAGTIADAIIFKLEVKGDSVKNTGVGTGALSLGDTLYHSVFTLKEQFTGKHVAYDTQKAALKLSGTTAASDFIIATAAEGDKYALVTDGKNVSLDINTAHLVLTGNVAYFNFEKVDAPEYATFETGHKRLTSDAKSLTMNPLNFLAEAKIEGQPIVKADYEKDNFSLWIEKAPSSTPDKPLYYIAKGIQIDGNPEQPVGMYYLASLRDSARLDQQGNALVGFITSDTIKTMDNSPALFAFKTTQDGGLILESQKELGDNTGKQYIGLVNNQVVMSDKGVEFFISNAPAPVANEETVTTEVTAIGDVGSVIITNASGRKISIANILGQVISAQYANSDYFIMPAHKGVVFVIIEGEKTKKALVK